MVACASPKLFAACHALHRPLVPRHPPCALCTLTSLISFIHYSVVKVLPASGHNTPYAGNLFIQAGFGTGGPCTSVHGLLLLRKEVIQPHLPVRLPCYDFTPLTRHTFDGSIPYGFSHRLRVYKARERIHRGLADPRLLAIPTSCSRVADCNPNWDRLLWGSAQGRPFASRCAGHCSTCVALDIRAMMT
jgi:hypothetical protein